MDSLYRLVSTVVGAAAISLSLTTSAWAQQQTPPHSYDDLTAHLRTTERAALLSENRVVVFDFESPDISLAPSLLAPNIDALIEQGDSGVTVEGLFFIPLTQNKQRQITPLTIYNITRAVSTLEGIEYYSASRERYRIFYEESYVIDSPKQRNRVDDPLVAQIPLANTQYLRQRDSSFGTNTYRAQYTHRDGITAMEIVNLTTMRYAIFPLVQPEGLHTLFAILPTDKGILFYGVSLVGVKNLFGFEDRVVNSFTNRLKAVFNWFESQLADEIGG